MIWDGAVSRRRRDLMPDTCSRCGTRRTRWRRAPLKQFMFNSDSSPNPGGGGHLRFPRARAAPRDRLRLPPSACSPLCVRGARAAAMACWRCAVSLSACPAQGLLCLRATDHRAHAFCTVASPSSEQLGGWHFENLSILALSSVWSMVCIRYRFNA